MAGEIKSVHGATDTTGMIRPFTQPRPTGVEGVILKQPSAATNNEWRVEIRKAGGCYDHLNATFAREQQEIAENYARRMMRILGTERLERVA